MNESLMIDLGIAKTEKYASRESGDTVELVERPGGGISVVMIDGQGSGKGAKTLSLLLSSKAVSLIKEGVRDGAVARATHDHLFAFRHGKVSATLDLVSVDYMSQSIVITRNADSPMLTTRSGQHEVIECSSGPIGRYLRTRPIVREYPLEAGVQVVLFTDGIPNSGRRQQLDPVDYVSFANQELPNATSSQAVADSFLNYVIQRDQGKPQDDMAIVVLAIRDAGATKQVRRIQARIPIV